MSQSPLGEEVESGSGYIDSFLQLAQRIRGGASFSGRERNCAFLNVRGETFADASAAWGLDLMEDSRGIAVCDWDHDGDIDLWLTNRTAPKAQLLQNAGGGRSVSFLLEGDPAKGCPRDAAGARVVIAVNGKSRMQTVHLGDGFVSQSSRWLVFGLGDDDPGKVVVFWPGGLEEEFAGAKEQGRFLLRQGSGKVAAVTQPGNSLPLPEEKMELPKIGDQARIWLSDPAPFSGMKELPEGAVFLNLWASWCGLCLTELKEFGKAGDLPVVYLNVEKGKIPEARMKEVLMEAGVKEKGRFASEEVIEELNEVVMSRIYRHRNLPIPTTVLIDRERRVRAIYKGPVSAKVLRRDLAKVDQTDREHLDASVPFAGKRSNALVKTDPLSVAEAYREGGYFKDARAYLLKYVNQNDGTEAGKERLADLRLKLGQLDRSNTDYAAAEQQLRLSLKASPGRVPSRILLALTLAELGKKEAALIEVNALKANAPGDANFINLEGEVYEILGEDELAVKAYREVLKSNRRYVPAIHSLASLLATSSKDGVRNGGEALQWATFLARAPGARNQPDFVITLADAHAEAGDFEKALVELARVRTLIGKYAMEDELDSLEKRVERYRNRRAFFRDEAGR